MIPAHVGGEGGEWQVLGGKGGDRQVLGLTGRYWEGRVAVDSCFRRRCCNCLLGFAALLPLPSTFCADQKQPDPCEQGQGDLADYEGAQREVILASLERTVTSTEDEIPFEL